MKKTISILLVSLLFFGVIGCEFTTNNEPKEEEIKDDARYEIYKLAQTSGFEGTYEEWLTSIRGDEVEIKSMDGFLMWKYKSETESNWRILYNLTSLKGEQGQQGETGPQGIPGEQGPQGASGLNGENGKSAYEIFKENYPEYTGTEKEWVTAVAKNDLCALFGHEWDEGVITLDAQVGVNGEKTYTCNVCGNHKYEVIPMITPLDTDINDEEGVSYIYFGKYPQTHVSDETIISELNKLTETNATGYYEYDGNEYAKVVATPYNYSHASTYTDDWGEVHNIYYSYLYSDGVEIQRGTTEYFLVEPIKWRILESSDGEYLVITDKVIDQSVYYINSYNRLIEEEVVYANNYKYSTIREYINNEFYNKVFSEEQQNAIKLTEVDNSASTTWSDSNPYACENTNDKMFLLSYQEAAELFDSNQSRQAKTTDYAKAKGVYFNTSTNYYGNTYWWLRSPSDDAYSARIVNFDGSAYYAYGVYNSYLGLRPTCIINLQ